MNEDEMFELAFQAMSLNNEQKEEPKVKKKGMCENCDIPLFYDEYRATCTECGMVTEENMMSEEPEWNNYQNDGGTSVDNSRCTWTGDTGLYEGENQCGGTTVSRFTKHTPRYLRYTWDNSRNRSLYKVYIYFDKVAAEHGILSMILNTCKYIYKYISTHKLTRGKIRNAIQASCMYYAFIYHSVTRTVSEVGEIFRIDHKKITKINKQVSELLWNNPDYKFIITKVPDIQEYVYRYIGRLNLNQGLCHVCIKYYNDIDKNKIIGKELSYIIAGTIWIVCNINDVPIQKDNICKVCDLSTVTLNKIIKIIE